MNRILVSTFLVFVFLVSTLFSSPGLAKSNSKTNIDDVLFLTTMPTEDYYNLQRKLFEKLIESAGKNRDKPVDLRCARENFDIFFEFIEPNAKTVEWRKKDGKGDPLEYKPWSSEEKRLMKGTLELILAKYPGLVLSASAGERLKFVRVNKYARKYNDYQSFDCWAGAETDVPVVLIVEECLNSEAGKKELQEILIHEIAHLVDFGARYSLSETWLKNTEKKLAPTYNAWKMNDLNKVYKLCKQASLPRFYSTFNYQECFADCLASYLTKELKEETITNLFEKKILNKVLNPSDSDCLWQIKFRNGLRAYKLGQIEKSEELYSQALKITPEHPCLLNCQARNYYNKKEYSKGLRLSKRAVKDLLRIGHSSNDSEIIQLKICYAHNLIANRKFHSAIRICNELMHNFDQDCYHARAACYENLGQYYNAASDYMKGKVPIDEPGYRGSYRVSQDDFESSLKWYNEKVAKYPASKDYRRKRATFLSGVVFSDYDNKNKDKLFEIALNDFEEVMKTLPEGEAFHNNPDEYQNRLEYDCIRLCCHNNKLELATEHCKNILRFDPENHKVLAIAIGAYTNLGDKANALRYYKKLDEQITKEQMTKTRLNRCHDLRFMNYEQFNCDERPVLRLILKDLKLVLKDYKSNKRQTWLSKSSECMRVESLCAKICFRLKKYRQALKHCDNLLEDDSDMYDKVAYMVKIGALERSGKKKETIATFNKFKKEFKL